MGVLEAREATERRCDFCELNTGPGRAHVGQKKADFELSCEASGPQAACPYIDGWKACASVCPGGEDKEERERGKRK